MSSEVQQQSTTRVQIRGAVLPNHTSPGTNNSQDLSPHPKAKGGYPLIHQGKLQYTGTDPGSNKDCHPCPSPLTIGNSRMVDSTTPLETTGSRAPAMRRELVSAARDQTAKVPAFRRPQHTMPPGLAPGGGPGPVGHGWPYQGHKAPDNGPPRIIETCKPLH
ncbi:hypothetical protein D4764_12G0008140 [Takifugu flavidus]|uniref:Uncharacterized protein n=1 Tax=Takifugu flavidus TaxID=433684 RepID=A0A5C6PC86_9TELE|nr:hypothetical protein D4764_12G0008140 [Takifugu flavidus]